MSNPEVKVLIFSEWERMLELVGGLCRKLRVGFAEHSGSVTPAQRRMEVQRFRADPECRVLLSTDGGGAGLNLQNASVVINCDLPWNPARLEQRISRAWRQDQTRAVTVLNIVSERTIEHRMLGMISRKQALSAGVLDDRADLSEVKLVAGREDILQQIEQLFPALPPENRVATEGKGTKNPASIGQTAAARKVESSRADRPTLFCQQALELLDDALVTCEERFPSRGEASVLLVVVENDADAWRARLAPLEARVLRAPRDDEPAPDIRLEIVDRPTAELLRRLAESGVVSPSLRASRVLYPPPVDHTAPLTPQEQNRARQAREQHARRVKMARLLAAEEMTEESRAATVAAIHEMGRALAIEHRQSEPINALGAVAPPLDAFWPGGDVMLVTLRSFLSDEAAPIQPVIAALGQPTEAGVLKARDFFAGIKARIATI